MLSDEIGKKLESIIDRVPGGVNVRPLIESSVQIACLMTFRAEKARRNRWERVAALRGLRNVLALKSCHGRQLTARVAAPRPSGPNLTLGTHRQTADLDGAKTLTGANLIGSPRTNPIVPAGPSAHANPVRRILGRRQRRDQ